MRYYISRDMDLKLGMDINKIHGNTHAKFFYPTSTHLGDMTL